MIIEAILRDPERGHRALHRCEWGDSKLFDNEGILYQWLEGNYACDCNRRLFIARARNEEPCDDDLPCGRVVVLDRLTRDGVQIYP